VAINVYGSYERMRLALGVENFEQLADRVQELVKPVMPTTLLEKMKKLPQLAKLAGFGPKVVKRGMCQEVVHTESANLLTLPIIQCWPHDGEPMAEPKETTSKKANRGSKTRRDRKVHAFASICTKDPIRRTQCGMYRAGPEKACGHACFITTTGTPLPQLQARREKCLAIAGRGAGIALCGHLPAPAGRK
jgi:hypothetical protein